MGDENDKKLAKLSEEQWDGIHKGIKNHLKYMRLRAGFSSQQDVKDIASYNTYRNMETGKEPAKTSFRTFIEAFHLFHGTDRDAAVLFGNHESYEYVATDHNPSEQHMQRLKVYQNNKYNMYFVDTQDAVKAFSVDFKDIINYTYVAAEGKFANNYCYDGKLLSPDNSEYTYIYFTCTNGLIDKALFIIPYVPQVLHEFKMGIGVMLSIAVNYPRCPEFKLFFMMSDNMERPEDEFIKKHLIMKTAAHSKYMVRVPNLMDRNRMLMDDYDRWLLSQHQKTDPT